MNSSRYSTSFHAVPIVYEPVTSVEPRVGVPRVIRDDARYQTAAGEAAQREAAK